MSKFLKENLKNIEDELFKFICEFFNQIKEDENLKKDLESCNNKLIEKKEDFKMTEIFENLKQILTNTDKVNNENYSDNKYYITKLEIEMFLKNEKNLNFDLCDYIDVLRLLYFSTLNKNYKNSEIQNFENSLINSTTLEIKNFLNFFLSQQNLITDELMQRFFENIFFLFKNLKFPKYQKNIFSDYLIKDLNIIIKSLMTLNSQKENSFNLKYSILNNLDQELKDFYTSSDNLLENLEEKEKNIPSNYEEGNYVSPMILDSNILLNIFTKNEKEKLFDFRIDFINAENFIEIKKGEVKISGEKNYESEGKFRNHRNIANSAILTNSRNLEKIKFNKEKNIKNEISYKNLMNSSFN